MELQIRHKMNIFISSKCGQKYTVARKALDTLLRATGLAEVYVFEEEPGSSLDTRSAYLDEVERADLCVFLIDNKDGVSDSVLREQKRAKEKGLRLIYIFCDEEERKPTLMQQELTVSLTEKYFVVHEFADVVGKAYESVIQDIISVYRHKFFVENTVQENEKITASIIAEPIFSIPKDKTSIFHSIEKELVKMIEYYPQGEESDSSQLDKLSLKYFQFVMRKESFDEEAIIPLCDEIVRLHDEKFEKFLRLRFEAIIFYSKGDYIACIEKLSLALDEAVTNTTIPCWLANDVAIDIRSARGMQDELESKFTHPNQGQSFIDESKETVFYPVLDRKVSNLEEQISKYYFEHLNMSPYTTLWGGLEPIFTNIAEAFGIALFYGSIINMEMVKQRVAKALQMICTLYDEHDLNIELIRLLIINCNTKLLKTIIRTYNHESDIVSSKDIQLIGKSIDNIYVEHRRYMSKYLLITHFGLYFDDEMYDEYCNDLIAYSLRWVENEHRIFNMSAYIFEFYCSNEVRLQIEDSICFIGEVFRKGLKRWYDDCLKIIGLLDMKNAVKEKQKIVLSILSGLLERDEYSQVHGLDRALVQFATTSIIDKSELEKLIKEKMEIFYNTTYAVDVKEKTKEETYEHVQRYLHDVHERNLTQGKNGMYTGYLNYIYQVIHNILQYNDMVLDKEQVGKIINSVLETLSFEKQLIGEKIAGLELLIYLYFEYGDDDVWKGVIEQLVNNKELFLKGYSMGIGAKDDTPTISFVYELCLKIMEVHQELNWLDYIMSFSQADNYYILRTLKIIEKVLVKGKDKIEDDYFIKTMMYFSIMMSKHKERDIKFYAVKCLIALSNYEKCNEAIIIQLSKIMDSSIADIKITIVSRINKIHNISQEYRDYILQKAKVDNNYLVRKVALREIEKITAYDI